MSAPGPAAWGLLIAVLSCPLLSRSSVSNLNTCCAEEQPPISNCSFSYVNAKEKTKLVKCSVNPITATLAGRCPDYGYTTKESIPAPVKSIKVKHYVTSCAPTVHRVPLRVSACNASCPDHTRTYYSALNVTIELDPYTAEDVEAIELSLRYGDGVTIWCTRLELPIRRSGYANQAIAEHTFYYDGFIGLQPSSVRNYEGDYIVTAKTLPTDLHNSNARNVTVRVPMETCWVPEVKVHNTPFAVNFTLFKDTYNLSKVDMLLHDTPAAVSMSRNIDFRTAALYNLDGKWGTNIFFKCLMPSDHNLTLYIYSPECPYCDWYNTKIMVKGWMPDVEYHPSPYAVNFTLFQDSVYQLDVVKVQLMPHNKKGLTQSANLTQEIDFKTAKLHRVDGKLATNVVFECLEPLDYTLSFNIHPSDCPDLIWNVTTIKVQDPPPKKTFCPADVEKEVIKGSVDYVSSINVTEPIFDFYCNLQEQSIKRTHDLSNSTFLVDTTTKVCYTAKEYHQESKCCFDVTIIEVTPPIPLVVIAVSCGAGMVLVGVLAFLVFWKKSGSSHPPPPDSENEHNNIGYGKPDPCTTLTCKYVQNLKSVTTLDVNEHPAMDVYLKPFEGRTVSDPNLVSGYYSGSDHSGDLSSHQPLLDGEQVVDGSSVQRQDSGHADIEVERRSSNCSLISGSTVGPMSDGNQNG